MSPMKDALQPPVCSKSFLGVSFDRVDLERAVALVGDSSPETRFRYVVTPNVDHVVRLSRSEELREVYGPAWLTLCDSRPIRLASRFVGPALPLVTGSDLTAALFHGTMAPGTRVAVIAPSQPVLERLAARFPQFEIVGYVPPAGIDRNPEELARCTAFAREAGAPFLFIAVGSPQSEKIARALSCDPHARGTAFCVGAAIEFVAGTQARAPRWVQRAGLEWLHRLSGDPRRLWRRYAFTVVPFIRLVAQEARQRYARPAKS